jgi:hypothetical protein
VSYSDDRVPGYPVEDLVAGHVLDDPAGLETLPRIAVARPRVLITGEPATTELPVAAHDIGVAA